MCRLIHSFEQQQTTMLAAAQSFLESAIENRFLAERDRLATKEDLSKTKNEIILWIVGFNTVLAGIIITLIKVL